MSSILVRSRLKRVILVTTVIAAATVAVVALTSAGAPSPAAAAESLHPASASTYVATGTAVAARSDSQLIADAAPERALAAQQAALAAQQAAIAAQQAAAAQAAAQAAAAKAAAARATALAAARRTLNVWTAGFQTEINECRGGVDVTAHYGTPTVAEHWSCGGSTFPTVSGTVVTFTGLDAGTYRVVGVVAVLNAYTATTSQIPTGYSMLLQTCRNGDSHYTEFVGLQKIG